jgi:transcriptional regulator with XRE-family HTH domain
MTEELDDLTTRELAQRRLGEFLEAMSRKGLTQQLVAAQAGIPAQYISDIKHDRRPMTELVARRLSEQFNVNYEWLLGTSDSTTRPSGPAHIPNSVVSVICLPVFPHPIDGEPRANPKWDGKGLEIVGTAAAKLGSAQQPYVLQFGHDDVMGRIRKGDYLLISQAASDTAKISVVMYRKKMFLARRKEDGDWERVANSNTLPADCPIKGHCIGILWSSLCY